MNFYDKYGDKLPVPLTNEVCEQKEKLRKRIWKGIRLRRKNSIIRIAVWSSAATIVLTLSAAFFLSAKRVLSGETECLVVLPCGSQVNLEANSELRYNSFGWMFARHTTLNGNASFEVSKGRKFCVRLPQGSVKVLGTKFHVESADETMIVKCYEGAVGVDYGQGSVVLNSGEQVECGADGMSTKPIEEPMPDYLTFNDVRLNVVIDKMKEIFGLTFINDETVSDYRFTGFMSTHNLNEAISVVFGSCDIKYILQGDKVLIVK